MQNFPCRPSNKGSEPVSSAALVLEQCHRRMDQLVLELKPERGVKGALAEIASEAGLPYSKVRRIFYRLTQTILAFERDRLDAAITKISLKQEARIEQRLNSIRALRDERALLEKHLDLPV